MLDDDKWRIQLLKCSEELTADLSFDMISPCLLQRGIINTDQYATIREIASNQERIQHLLCALLEKDEAGYQTFLTYLDSDFDWLSNQLKNTEVNAMDYNKFRDKLNSRSIVPDQRGSSNQPSGPHENTLPTYQTTSQSLQISFHNNTHPPQTSSQSDQASSRPHQTSSQPHQISSQSQHISFQPHQNGSHLQQTSSQPQQTGSQPHQTSSQPHQTSSQPNHTSSQPHHNSFQPHHNSSHPHQTISKPHQTSYQSLQTGSQPNQTHIQPPKPTPGGFDPSPETPWATSRPIPGHIEFSMDHSFGSSPARPCSSTHSPAHSTHSSIRSVTGSQHSGSSPLHSSDISVFSQNEDEIAEPSNARPKRRLVEDVEITEDMIEYVASNPMIMRRWQNLAHQAGLSNRVPVIQSRIRQDGRDFDEHIAEFIREWTERKPGEATLPGLINILRKLRFNDTAGRLEDGSFKKKLRLM